MANTRFDSRQTIHRQLLKALFPSLPTGGKELDNILESLDDELTMPLRMIASSPADLTVNIENILVSNTETNRRRAIPPINNLLPSFSSGTVEFPAASGGTITVTPGTNSTLTVTSGNYIKVGINITPTGNLTLTFGTEGVSESAATAPPTVSNTFAIGYVVIYNNAGTIENVENTDIVQYVGGGGGASGTGDANAFLETLKNMLQDSTYELLTPNIFASDEDDLVDGSSTGEYSLVTSTFEMDSSEIYVSTNLLDSDEFLDEGLDVQEIDLAVKWADSNVDTSATYEVSRDGGDNYTDISSSMERVGDATNTYVGSLRFSEESTFSSLDSNATSNNNIELDDTNILKLGQAFTVSNTSVLHEIDIDFTKIGSPTGYLWVAITGDDSGDPDLDDIKGESSAVDISGLSTGTKTISLPNIVLTSGTYHFVIRTDSTYQSGFATGATSIEVDTDSTGTPAASQYNGTAWSDAGEEVVYDLKGRELDLRVKITASASGGKLDGLGIFYNNQTGDIITGLKNIQTFKFKAVADNLNEFTLTKFSPDPDLLKCYYVESGQVFLRDAFELQGNKVVFPASTFNNGGVEADVTLIFQQVEGSSFDNSDQNAQLLAANFLGSTDSTIDKSSAGRGIFLRRPDGTLREIGIDDSDNIVIYSV